ncbi:MAG: glycosyltransferase family 1 protein [Mucinivorans sp.]
MKIGFDAKRLFCNTTGLGNYSRTLVKALGELYPQVEYILYSPKAPNNLQTQMFLESDSFKIRTAHFWCKSIWRASGIKKDMARDGLTIFHGLSHELPLGAKPKGMKYVVTMHDVCYRTFPEMFPWIERQIYKQKYANAIAKADKIVAISESTKEDLIRLFGVDSSRVEVIYQPLSQTYYTQQPIVHARATIAHYGIKGDYVLYVGSINERKNLLGVVRGYAMIDPEKRLPLVVIGAGQGKYQEKVMAEAESSGVAQDMVIIDSLSLTSALQAFYQCATMMVYPSFYEGFGLPVAEALLSGTPVITSAISSLPEAAGPGALYVEPNDPSQISQAIVQLMNNKALRDELAKRGMSYVLEKFAPIKLTQSMMNLYQSI